MYDLKDRRSPEKERKETKQASLPNQQETLAVSDQSLDLQLQDLTRNEEEADVLQSLG